MRALASLCLSLLASACLAQASPQSSSSLFPSKPIRFIVPDAPGSPPDIRARQISAKLSERLGQPVVLDNRLGASMMIGAEAAAHAPADGHTIFMGNGVTQVLNPILIKSLPYRAEENFVAVRTSCPSNPITP
jgi:tripartite-type tricarboxylate transporter receptor subunit TctC